MTKNEIIDLINKEVASLEQAIGDMLADTFPQTSPPRPRFFAITPTIIWPFRGKKSTDIEWKSVAYTADGCKESIGLTSYIFRDIILEYCTSPTRGLRVLMQLQAARAWCQARAEGRRRAAQEVLRQQRASIEKLQAIQVLETMGKP